MRDRSDTAVARHPAEAAEESTVRTLTDAADVAALVRLFEQVACEEGWQPGEGLTAFVDRSMYFALYAPGGEAIGGLQLVCPDATGRLPSHEVWPELARVAHSTCAHIAVLAVQKPHRGSRADYGALFWLLVIALWRHCVQAGITELWLEATPRTLACYQRLGWPLLIRGALRMHWGEPCYLCSLSVREVAGELAQRAVRSPTYRQILFHACAEMVTQGDRQGDVEEHPGAES
jgi:hypothetical protein